jgi:carboxyl-terminal processing protease
MSPRLRRFSLIALLAAAAFSAGLVFSPPLQAGRFNPYQKLGVFTKVLSYIEGHYVEDIAETDLMYGAARGLTDVLDPHSRFMDPDEYDKLKKETEGNEQIEGIGIDVEKRKNKFVIVSPIEGSPAAKAGIEPGDVIKRVDGVDISTLEFDDAIARMQGPANSEVVLTIDRHGRDLNYRIKRGRYEVKAVEGHLIEPGIPYLKIRVFATNTDASLGELLDQLAAKSKGGFKGMILDLRRNPGGLLDQGIRVADRFISDGLIVRTVGKGGQVMDEARAHSHGTWDGFPMIALVDGATASAAEIVAGALQDHRRAVVLGTQTFGKGSVQTVIDIDGCGPKPCGLKLTVARYYTPNGRSIQGQGITPDVVVDATAPPDSDDADLPRERDLRKRLRNEQGDKPVEAPRLDDYQLQMALDYLHSWSVFARQTAKK